MMDQKFKGKVNLVVLASTDDHDNLINKLAPIVEKNSSANDVLGHEEHLAMSSQDQTKQPNDKEQDDNNTDNMP